MNTEYSIGEQIHRLAVDLYPISRSITGDGVRESLHIIQQIIPELVIHEVPSGTRVFDWVVPDEWNINEAWLEGPDGERVIDFAEHNLHLLGYSLPVDVKMDLAELQQHLYSLPELPDAIPYVTSYYSPRWGFCIADNVRKELKPGQYHAYIDSSLKPGSLTYGEVILPGRSSEEILLSTYICHPSMGNNELSGPCVTTFLTRWLADLVDRHYTYRIIFIPETIGSITYLSKHHDHLKCSVKAGFNVTCIGDERCYSYLPSRAGDTLADRVAQHVLKHINPGYIKYSYLQRGSDERQYCAPGIDLPVATIMRSKYGEYPEYHTSLDDLDFITPAGLQGGYIALKKALEILEYRSIPKVTVLCEPQLGRRGLYPTVGTKDTRETVSMMMDFIAYADGSNDLLDIAEIINKPVWEIYPLYETLMSHGVVEDIYPFPE